VWGSSFGISVLVSLLTWKSPGKSLWLRTQRVTRLACTVTRHHGCVGQEWLCELGLLAPNFHSLPTLPGA
jgi:hypothetical protein